ncbi:MAG: response regulator transcription factor [Lachnospiraceae bacterium]|jgi:two component transcriptional regulator, winged helix family
MNNKILIIEDEKPIAELLKYALEKERFDAAMAHTGEEAFEKIESYRPDLILLDLMLPDMDGLTICREVTANNKEIPIIIVSAKNDQIDKLIGLEYGADDYITKPFDIREVILRIKSVLRRLTTPIEKSGRDSVIEDGDLVLDIDKHELRKSGELIELTPKEFSLLETLIRNKGKALTRNFLLEQVWNFDYIGDTRTVDIHIQRLRKKLGNDNSIATVFGVGYKFIGE